MNILDSSAVLAAMFREPGFESVDARIDDSIICSVNASEVVSKLLDKGYPEDEVLEQYRTLRLAVVDFDESLALLAGTLRVVTRQKGLSLGDRACLALAIRENATALTADRTWAELDIGCKIEVIR
jgi:PIN domain nuclease of toxin-antitoxin system